MSESAIEARDHPLSVLPAHVPPDHVRPYHFGLRGSTTHVLPRLLIPDVHENPPIFWAADIHHLLPGGWVPCRYSDLQQIYQDTEDFTPQGTSGVAQMIGESLPLVWEA